MKRISTLIMMTMFVCYAEIKASSQDSLCQQITVLFDRAYTETLQNGHSTVTGKVITPSALTYEALGACAQQYHKVNPVINTWDYNLNVKLDEKEITIFMSKQRIKHFLQTRKEN